MLAEPQPILSRRLPHAPEATWHPPELQPCPVCPPGKPCSARPGQGPSGACPRPRRKGINKCFCWFLGEGWMSESCYHRFSAVWELLTCIQAHWLSCDQQWVTSAVTSLQLSSSKVFTTTNFPLSTAFTVSSKFCLHTALWDLSSRTRDPCPLQRKRSVLTTGPPGSTVMPLGYSSTVVITMKSFPCQAHTGETTAALSNQAGMEGG